MKTSLIFTYKMYSKSNNRNGDTSYISNNKLSETVNIFFIIFIIILI